MACAEVWILILFIASSFSSRRLNDYVRTYKDMSVSDPILGNHTSASRVHCMVLCDLEVNTLYIQYNRGSGLCECYKDIPESLILVSEPASDVYVISVMEHRFVAATLGYTYDEGASFCYKIYSDLKLWGEAQSHCVSEGGFLAKLDTEEKRNLILSHVNEGIPDLEDESSNCYIGGKDKEQDGVWRWVADNSVIPEINVKGRKHCLVIDTVIQGFDDAWCSYAGKPFICEIPTD